MLMDKEKKYKIVASIILTICISFLLEIIAMLYGSFSNDKEVSELVPYSFHWVWELAAIIASYYIIKRFKVKWDVFYIALFVSMIISVIAWMFIPNSMKILEANYYGVETRITNDIHEEGRADENLVHDYPLCPGFLYKKNDPALLKEFRKAEVLNEHVNTRGFLFWQTGLAYGFIPDLLGEYNGDDNILDHIELFFTVGPLVLVECFIDGVYTNFLILIITQFIWFVFKRDFIWWR